MEQKERPAPGAAATKPVAEPVIIYSRWCKGCGICVEFCPKKVLELSPEGIAKVEYPEECTRCQLCEILCPDFAITVLPRATKANTGNPKGSTQGDPVERGRRAKEEGGNN